MALSLPSVDKKRGDVFGVSLAVRDWSWLCALNARENRNPGTRNDSSTDDRQTGEGLLSSSDSILTTLREHTFNSNHGI